MLKTVDVSDLPEPLVLAIESLVNTYRERMQSGGNVAERPLGWLEGQFKVPDSFFEPLPDDVLEMFEGAPVHS